MNTARPSECGGRDGVVGGEALEASCAPRLIFVYAVMISAVSQCSDRLICAAFSGKRSRAACTPRIDELEVRVVVALVGADHQEVALAVGARRAGRASRRT